MSASQNFLTNVALIGASGHIGRFILKSLLGTGKHTVTILSRPDSTATFPTEVSVVKVDYANKEALVAALRGQDALVITLSTSAPPETHGILVEAAGDAGVRWLLPNHWAHDTTGTVDPELSTDVPYFAGVARQLEHIRTVGKSSYVGVATGFWAEWSMGIPDAFGFDIKNRKAVFFDDGTAKLSLSTWKRVGEAVAALLSLPVETPGDGEPSLSDFRDKEIYVASFTVSQQDMFESLLRVTGTTKADWTIEHESSVERVAKAVEVMKGGDRLGFVRLLYTRLFYPEKELGNTEKTHGLANGALGLEKEDLDAATALGIERSKGNPWA